MRLKKLIVPVLLLLTGCSAAAGETPPAAQPAAAAGEPAAATRAPAQAATPQRAALPDYGPAPEFTNATWLNVDRPPRLAELRGKVAQDNDGATWNAYGTRYWPTLYLIDKRGHLRYTHIGEGRYAETEAAIQALLAERYP